MNEQMQMEEMKHVLQGPRASVAIVYVFGQGMCAQVMQGARKVGPVIIPQREKGQTLGDVLHMMGDWVEEGR